MKKTHALILIVGLLFNISKGQNLVPNPSFEDTISCPNLYGQVNKCLFWMNFGNSPDYFHSCADSGGVTTPYTPFGFQVPRSGNAYCGIINYSNSVLDSNYREFLGILLTQPLQQGITYYVSFFFNKAYLQVYSLCTNRMGLCFTNIQYSMNNPPPLINTADLYSDTIVTDTLGWTELRGTYTPTTNFQYLVIGNFFDDQHTDTLGLGAFPNIAYYFVDDVCVSADSNDCFGTASGNCYINFNDDVRIFPNPGSNFLNIVSTTPINSIIIQDSMGKSIKQIVGLNTKELIVDINELQSGIYYIKVNHNFYKQIITN